MKIKRNVDGEAREARQQRLLNCALLVAIACVTLYMLYINFAKLNPYGLDSDLVNEISYRQASWEQKTLFPDGFWSSAESFVTRPILLYWLFYGMTGNFLLSFQLENACTFLVGLVLLYFLLKKLISNQSVRLLCVFLFLAALPSYIRAVCFLPGNYYILFIYEVLATLLLRSALRDCIRKNESCTGRAEGDKRNIKRNIYIYILAMCGIAVIAGYGTMKLLLWIYLPWCVVDGTKLLADYINKKTLEKDRLVLGAVSLACLVLNALVYGIFMHFHGEHIVKVDVTIPDINEWFNWDVLTMRFTCILHAMGVVGAIGTDNLGRGYFVLHGCIAALNIFSVGYLFSRKNQNSDKRDLVWYWLIVTTLVAVFLIFQRANYLIYRYFTVTGILTPILCGCALCDWLDRGGGKTDRWPCWGIVFCLICLFCVHVKLDSSQYSAPPSDLVKVAEYVHENGYQYVTGTYWNAGVIKGYTNGAVEAQHSSWRLAQYNILIDEHTFFDERLGIPNILIFTDDEEADIVNENGRDKYLLDTYAEKVTEIGIYNLYALTENPFTLDSVGLPAEKCQSKSDYPDAFGMQHQNSNFTTAHELVSDGTEGLIMWGPNTASIPGTYDITLHYEIVSTEDTASGCFDVALDGAAVASTGFDASHTRVVMEDVVIEAGHLFEVQVIVPQGMVVRIQSVEYERVG